MTPDLSAELGNWRGGNYPPIYYGVMNLFIQDTLDESVTVMRSVNAALVVLLVGGLAWLLPRRLRFLPPVTFVISAVPLALFMYELGQPQWVGDAERRACCGWPSTVRTRRRAGDSPALLGVALVAALMGSGARADAALFSVLGVALALGLRLARPAAAVEGHARPGSASSPISAAALLHVRATASCRDRRLPWAPGPPGRATAGTCC